MEQQGDIVLFQTADGGDISVTGGIVLMGGGLQTAAYLSLFGGNQDDSGAADDSRSWWGNTLTADPSEHYRSRTQYLLDGLPAVSANLGRLEDAALQDLKWLLGRKVATAVTVSATLVAPKRVRFVVSLTALGEESRFEFVENWKNYREPPAVLQPPKPVTVFEAVSETYPQDVVESVGVSGDLKTVALRGLIKRAESLESVDVSSDLQTVELRSIVNRVENQEPESVDVSSDLQTVELRNVVRRLEGQEPESVDVSGDLQFITLTRTVIRAEDQEPESVDVSADLLGITLT